MATITTRHILNDETITDSIRRVSAVMLPAYPWSIDSGIADAIIECIETVAGSDDPAVVEANIAAFERRMNGPWVSDPEWGVESCRATYWFAQDARAAMNTARAEARQRFHL